jgi:hypothetical protein
MQSPPLLDSLCDRMNIHDMAFNATCLGLVLACLTSGHMTCHACIPLEDLLAPDYGISVSVDGL